MKKFLLLISLFIFTSAAFAQKKGDCKVLLPTLEESYTGECKKGLAEGTGKAVGLDQYKGEFKKGLPHGKGTYTWSNGDYYIGNWKNGKRHGKGMMRIAGEATTEKPKDREGIWKNGEFLRVAYEALHKFIRKQNIASAYAKKMDDAINRIQININNSSQIGNLMILNDSGVIEQDGKNRITVRDPQFPIHMKLNYRTSTLISNTKVDVVVEFILESPGNWMVTLRH